MVTPSLGAEVVKWRVWPLVVGLCTLPVLAEELEVESISDIDFGTSFSGDPPKTLPSVNYETLENASVRVTGPVFSAFEVNIIPSELQLQTTSIGAGDGDIRIFDFQILPISPQTDGSGTAMVYITATQDLIAVDQISGAYEGHVTVEVIKQ